MSLQKKESPKNDGEKKPTDAAPKKDDGLNIVVFKTDIHCEGCAKKIKRAVKNFEGMSITNYPQLYRFHLTSFYHNDKFELRCSYHFCLLNLKHCIVQKTKKKSSEFTKFTRIQAALNGSSLSLMEFKRDQK